MKLKLFAIALLMMAAISSQAELKRAEMTVYGMD